MRLSAILLTNFCDINMFSQEDQWRIRAYEPNTLYFELVDLDQCKLRYLPGIGTANQPYSVSVTFPSIDDSKILTIQAVQVSPADASVWAVTIQANQVPQSGNVGFSVTEGNVTRSFRLTNALAVEFVLQDGSC